jgi:FkbM family methyltransferase
MRAFTKWVAGRVIHFVEALSGCEVEWYGARTFAMIDKHHRLNASFSYRAQFRSAIERSGIDLVIDAGANEGQFARRLRSFYGGEILSFEPVTFAFDKLAKAASTDPDWHVYKLALGSEDSTQTINVSDRTLFSSLLNVNDYCVQRFGESVKGERKEVIRIRRLDQLLEEIVPDIGNRRVFLKMDTQGYDLEVFKGLGDCLARVIGLQSEVSLISIYEGMPHWTDSISLYEQAGFGVVGMFPVNRDSGLVIEYDCLLERVAASPGVWTESHTAGAQVQAP